MTISSSPSRSSSDNTNNASVAQQQSSSSILRGLWGAGNIGKISLFVVFICVGLNLFQVVRLYADFLDQFILDDEESITPNQFHEPPPHHQQSGDAVKNEVVDSHNNNNNNNKRSTNHTTIRSNNQDNNNNNNRPPSQSSESVVFQNVVDRAVSSNKSCLLLSQSATNTNQDYLKRTEKFTNASLTEYGVIEDLTSWMATTAPSTNNNNDNNDNNNNIAANHNIVANNAQSSSSSSSVMWDHEKACRLPPERSCDVEGFTVVFMSHSLERINLLSKGIIKVASWKATHEIILVWNSDPQILKQNDKVALL